MTPTGNAAKSGQINTNDRVISISGTSVATASREQCIAAIKKATAASTIVRITLKRQGSGSSQLFGGSGGPKEVEVDCGLCKFGGGFSVAGVHGARFLDNRVFLLSRQC
jgi:hypothetical protein